MANNKPTKKEFIQHELEEIFSIILYLSVCLCLIATFKALVLIQTGVNEFIHLYTVAIIQAVALGKFAAMAQNLRIMNAYDHRPLIWSVLYKSALMTLVLYITSLIEEAIFAHFTHHHNPPTLHPIILIVAHNTASMFIFMVLFTVRGLDQRLGKGQLLKILTENKA